MRIPSLLQALLLSFAACATTDPMRAPRADRTEAGAPADRGDRDPVAVDAAARAAGGATGSGPLAASLAQHVRSLWSDPAFRQHLAESYAAVSDVEPAVGDDDLVALLEVQAAIGDDDLRTAERRLADLCRTRANAVFDFTLGNVCFQQGQLERAARAFELAVHEFPRFRRAWAHLGQVRFQRDDAAGAALALARVIELGGGDALTYGLLGVAHTRCGAPASAESAFRLAAMLAPGAIEWRLGIVESLFGQARFGDAAAMLDELISEHPARADLWLAQGEARARTDRQLEAAASFEMVDALGASTAASLQNLADIYANHGSYAAAVDACLRALRKDPAAVGRALRAARYLAAHAATSESRALVEGIAELCGDRLERDQRKALLELRATLAAADGLDADEARALEEIVALDPLDGVALIRLGRHHGRSGEREKAVFLFERAAGIDGFEAEAKLRHGELLAREGRYAEALPLLQRAQVLAPRDHVRDFVEQVERAAQSR